MQSSWNCLLYFTWNKPKELRYGPVVLQFYLNLLKLSDSHIRLVSKPVKYFRMFLLLPYWGRQINKRIFFWSSLRAKVKQCFLFIPELTPYSLSRTIYNQCVKFPVVYFSVVMEFLLGPNVCVTLNRTLLNLSESQFTHF